VKKQKRLEDLSVNELNTLLRLGYRHGCVTGMPELHQEIHRRIAALAEPHVDVTPPAAPSDGIPSVAGRGSQQTDSEV